MCLALYIWKELCTIRTYGSGPRLHAINTVGVLLEAEHAYPSRSPGFTPGFWCGRVAHIFSFRFCDVVFFVFCLQHRVSLTFVLVLCSVCPMFPVSLDCPFLIARSVFSNVYSKWNSKNTKKTNDKNKNLIICIWSAWWGNRILTANL